MRQFLYLLFLVTALFLKGCNENGKDIVNATLDNLLTKKPIQYNINKTTIEGHDNYTLNFSTDTEATFQHFPQDTLIGYKFYLEDNLVHPHFQVPVNNNYYYDSEYYLFRLISDAKKAGKKTKRNDLDISKLKWLVKGNIPTLVKILKKAQKDPSLKLQDTIFNEVKCVKIDQNLNDYTVNLFINKNTNYPHFLRITFDKEKPIIHEFHYRNFKYLDSFEKPALFNKPIRETMEPEVLSINDSIPSWELKYLNGTSFNFSSLKGATTYLYLSMIQCVPCQKLLPYIETIYNKHQKKKIQFKVFYPIDTREKLVDYTKANNINYPVIYNPRNGEENRFDIINKLKYGYPTLLVLNENKQIIKAIGGYKGIADKFELKSKKVNSEN